ncbi:acyltransferase [Bosea sp. 117]|uniref:acyltransferase family protein n=1 Tax=Bosea sp. 117 TaxID=1125973 RepID=UPI0004946BD5|nr:acyltransferase [Bosea sp. 117]
MDEHRNSFDALRLLAALLVLVGHLHGMLGNPLAMVPLVHLPLESVGVTIFFFVSGYLISRSVLRGASARYYIASRMLRIYPGLIVALLASIALGLVIGRLPPAQFLADPGTLRFLFGNLVPFFQEQPIALPGVFETAIWPAVNGSLWTIKYELICYLIFFAFCLIPQPRLRLAAMACAVATFFIYAYVVFPKLPPPSPDILFTWVNRYYFVLFTFCFGLGSALAMLSSLRWFDFRLAAVVAAALVFALPGTDLGRAANLLLICTLSLGIARLRIPVLSRVDRVGDLSYGVYLYAYPVSNFGATYLAGTLPVWGIYAFTLVVTFALAFLSWKLVEAPALALRRRLRRTPRPAVPVSEPSEALNNAA